MWNHRITEIIILSPEINYKCQVWNHLRICLRKNNQQTMAACVCQLFKTGRAKEFRKAAEVR